MKKLMLFSKHRNLFKRKNPLFFAYLFLALAFFGASKLNGQSTLEVPNPSNATQKIIVYKDVPSHPTDAALQIKPSDRYKIEVRILGTTTWIPVFAHKTYNQNGVDFTTDLPVTDGGNNPNTSLRNYINFTAKWTHTYGNIEMTPNTSVQVRITKLDGTSTPQPIAITKAAAHPVQKIVGTIDTTSGGTGAVIFTIDKPGQIVIDFDGAMDDSNKGLLSSTAQLAAPHVHAVSIFANPVMTGKPAESGDSNVYYVIPGTIPPSDLGSKTTLYFLPGVHNIGLNFKLYPNKQYYFPGDAIVYGTFNNLYLPTGTATPTGRNIKVFGYGTISGAKQLHPAYVELVGGVATDTDLYKSIEIDDGIDAIVEGVTIADPANHSLHILPDGPTFNNSNPKVPMTFAKWVKIISWRGNGDGIGSCHEVSDCFFRTNDDAGYIKGSKFRNIFWKDSNAAIFHMAGIPIATEYFPLKIEDCEVIYARSRNLDGSDNTGVFHQRATAAIFQTNAPQAVNLTITRFKVSDPLSNMPFINMFTQDFDNKNVLQQSGPSYTGLVFNNVEIASDVVKQTIQGNSLADWGAVKFNNCKIAGRVLSSSDFKTVNVINYPINLRYATLVFTPSTNLGIADAILPDNPTAPVASAIGNNQQTISWTAASGSQGVDGGGYMVVRGTAPIGSTPSNNDIYVVNNTVAAGELMVYVGTGISFTDNGLDPATTYYYKIYSVDKSYNYGNTPVTITSTTTMTVITASTVSLSGFLTTPTIASSAQTFTVSGIDLFNNLIVCTASTDFELSTNNFATDGTAFINLGSGPIVASTPIYIRLKAGLSLGTKTTNISIASSGANTLTDVNVTGDVVTAVYYYAGSGLLSSVSNWGTNPNGSGTNPASLTGTLTQFIIRNTTAVSTNAAWILGANSKLTVGNDTVPAVTLTVANGFPITGTIDIPVASSGSNSVLWKDTTVSPTFGTLHASSEVHFQPAASASYATAATVFGKLFVDGAGAVTFSNSTPSVGTSLTVALNSSLSLTYNGTSYLTLGTGAKATINGTLKTTRGSGSGIFSFSGVASDAVRFADAITTPSILTLGTNSTIEYSNGTTSQTVSVLPSGQNYANLTLSGTSGTKSVGGSVSVTGKLTVNLTGGGSFAVGGITLKSTATKTAVVAPVTGIISGNIIVERYIPAGFRQYRLLSPATTGGTIKANWQENQADGVDGNLGFGTHITGAGAAANGFDTTTSNASSLFTHNNEAPAAWIAVANTNVNTLTAGSPFLIYIRGSRKGTNISSTTNDTTTLRTTGTLATGTQVVSGLNTTANGFSLLGNPYQAQVDMQAVLATSTDLVKGFYYVLNPNGVYSTFDFGLNTGTSGSANKYLHAGQACFVKTVAAPTAPTLLFTEANKSEALAQTSVFRTKQLANILRLSLYDTAKPEDAVDGLIVAFDLSETNDINENDANKLTNFNENMASSNSGKLLSIEKRAIPTPTDEIPLSITKYKGTSYSLKVQGSGLTETPYLVDAFTGTTTEIPQDGTVDYAYTVDAGNFATIAASRFKLIYAKTLKNKDNAVSAFALYPNPSKSNSFNVMVPQSMSKASLTVSNISGQLLYSQNDLQSGATVRVNVSNVKTAGVYLVSLTSEGKTTTVKWIVE